MHFLPGKLNVRSSPFISSYLAGLKNCLCQVYWTLLILLTMGSYLVMWNHYVSCTVIILQLQKHQLYEPLRSLCSTIKCWYNVIFCDLETIKLTTFSIYIIYLYLFILFITLFIYYYFFLFFIIFTVLESCKLVKSSLMVSKVKKLYLAK